MKMRIKNIKYIANVRIPTERAHGYQIMKMCESFSQNGCQVELLVPGRKNHILEDPFIFYKIKRNYIISVIPSFDPFFLFKFPFGLYIKIQTLIFNLALFFRLIFMKNKDSFIFYTRDELLLPLLLFFSKKVIWESHALPKNKVRYSNYFKKCHRIFTLTKKTREDLIQLGVDEKKVFVSPDAVDLEIFDINLSKDQARHEVGLAADKFIIGYAGSFKTKGMDKGILDIIKALSLIISQLQNILFVAVGGTSDDIKYYTDISIKFGVHKNIVFLGKVDQNMLATYLKAFDILLMPFPFNQHYAYYMSPLKMFEYMAANRPIIASDLPSVREVLNEKNAFFCKPDDPKDLAEKILGLAEEPILRDRLSAQSYYDVRNYTWVRRATNIINSINL